MEYFIGIFYFAHIFLRSKNTSSRSFKSYLTEKKGTKLFYMSQKGIDIFLNLSSISVKFIFVDNSVDGECFWHLSSSLISDIIIVRTEVKNCSRARGCSILKCRATYGLHYAQTRKSYVDWLTACQTNMKEKKKDSNFWNTLYCLLILY